MGITMNGQTIITHLPSTSLISPWLSELNVKPPSQRRTKRLVYLFFFFFFVSLFFGETSMTVLKKKKRKNLDAITITTCDVPRTPFHHLIYVIKTEVLRMYKYQLYPCLLVRSFSVKSILDCPNTWLKVSSKSLNKIKKTSIRRTRHSQEFPPSGSTSWKPVYRSI